MKFLVKRFDLIRLFKFSILVTRVKRLMIMKTYLKPRKVTYCINFIVKVRDGPNANCCYHTVNWECTMNINEVLWKCSRESKYFFLIYSVADDVISVKLFEKQEKWDFREFFSKLHSYRIFHGQKYTRGNCKSLLLRVTFRLQIQSRLYKNFDKVFTLS